MTEVSNVVNADNLEALLRIAEALESIDSGLGWIVFVLVVGWFVWN